jgi:SAM-dependent methyltransferase
METCCCEACRATFACGARITRFLTSSRAHEAAAFHQQYRSVRQRDGHGPRSADALRALPAVSGTGRDRSEWVIRQGSFASLLALMRERNLRSARTLDAGAGAGWMSNQLAARGHRPVAVDRYDDCADGLGACAAFDAPFPAVQADFDALPFADRQFDVVAFNASLHYSPDLERTMGEACRVLEPQGVLVVMDSPMFEREQDGETMVRQQAARLRSELGIELPIRPGIGFLTEERLAEAAASHGRQSRFISTAGPIGWRLRRWWGSRRLDREPAAFGMWVAQ